MADRSPMILGSSIPEGGMVGGIEEAPIDGSVYGRRDGMWFLLDVQDAPSDGELYGRMDGTWRLIPPPAADSLPVGGTTGQVLTKTSDTVDGAADWQDLPPPPPNELPNAGTVGQVLSKASDLDGEVEWRDETPPDVDRAYVDAQHALLVLKSGDTLTGDLTGERFITLAGDPVGDDELTRRSYVDGKVSKAGDVLTGALRTTSGDPATDDELVSKAYVDRLVTATPHIIGAIDASTGNCRFGQGVAGPVPPADTVSPGNYLICDVAGTIPDGSAAGIHMDKGDWLLTDGTDWYDLNVGNPGVATTADQVGVIPALLGSNNVQAALARCIDRQGDTFQGASIVVRINSPNDNSRATLAFGTPAGDHFHFYRNNGGTILGVDSFPIDGGAAVNVLGIARATGVVSFNQVPTAASFTSTVDDGGFNTFSGGRFYKRLGGGLTVRLHVNNTQLQIENNDGSNRRDVIDQTNGDARYIQEAPNNATFHVRRGNDRSWQPIPAAGAWQTPVVAGGVTNRSVRWRQESDGVVRWTGDMAVTNRIPPQGDPYYQIINSGPPNIGANRKWFPGIAVANGSGNRELVWIQFINATVTVSSQNSGGIGPGNWWVYFDGITYVLGA
ncbi:MAG TPA: hypothetical protein VNZ45_01675 [Bacteroidia bacterium]|jgi:hypothetical protein|nr:hypothetical protein [Bacteroidia bacterium]